MEPQLDETLEERVNAHQALMREQAKREAAGDPSDADLDQREHLAGLAVAERRLQLEDQARRLASEQLATDLSEMRPAEPMNFHWEKGLLLEEGATWSDELPPAGAIAHVMELPHPEHPYQVTWLGARSSVHDFEELPSAQYATQDVAIKVVQAEVRAKGHTINGE